MSIWDTEEFTELLPDFGFSFEYPTLDKALAELFTGPAKGRVDAADCAIYYNDQCPVCSAEISHYQDITKAQKLPVTFCSISENGAALDAFGLSADEICTGPARRVWFCVCAA